MYSVAVGGITSKMTISTVYHFLGILTNMLGMSEKS